MRREVVGIVLVLVLAGLAGESAAKCRSLLVRIEGRLEGSLDGSEALEIELEPDAQVKQKPVVIKTDGSFDVTLSFYTLNGLKREDCSRKPKAVVVLLRRKGELLRSVRLEIGRDFVPAGDGDFRVREPVLLRTDKDQSK